MPIYEFECPVGDITERMVKPDTRTITCPKCYQPANKILSLCSFTLKGGGWYADGYSYRKDGGKKDAAKKLKPKKSKTEN